MEVAKEIFFAYTIAGMFIGALASDLDGSTKDFFKFMFGWLPLFVYGIFFSKKT